MLQVKSTDTTESLLSDADRESNQQNSAWFGHLRELDFRNIISNTLHPIDLRYRMVVSRRFWRIEMQNRFCSAATVALSCASAFILSGSMAFAQFDTIINIL